MPYDITDAKEDIARLYSNIEFIYKELQKKGILPEDKKEEKNG